MYKNNKIRATGVQVIGASIIILSIAMVGLVFMFIFIFDNNSISKWYIILSVLTIAICCYEFCKFVVYSSKITFDEEGNFIVVGNNPDLEPINTSCKDFVSYEVKGSKHNIVIWLENCRTGKTYYILNFTFTKKQIVAILQEIQNRGGLIDKEISLTNTK